MNDPLRYSLKRVVISVAGLALAATCFRSAFLLISEMPDQTGRVTLGLAIGFVGSAFSLAAIYGLFVRKPHARELGPIAIFSLVLVLIVYAIQAKSMLP